MATTALAILGVVLRTGPDIDRILDPTEDGSPSAPAAPMESTLATAGAGGEPSSSR